MPDAKTRLDIDLSKLVKVKGAASVLNKAGGNTLRAYPRLVYAPRQWGDGVRLEDVGVTVEDVCREFLAASGNMDAVAKKFGTTPDHVAEAVRYAAEAKYLDTA